MTALLAGEMRRILARRLVRVVFLLVAIGIVLAGVITFLKTQQLSDAAYQARVGSATIKNSAGTAVPVCPPGQNAVPQTEPGGGIGPSCVPQRELRVHDPRFHITVLRGVLEGVTAPFVLLSVLIGATAIGAEWTNRTITTILTWEPRRQRVFAAKLLASLAVTVGLTVVGLVVLTLALYPSALLHGLPGGTTAGANAAFRWSVVGVLLRAMAMAAVGTVIGFTIAAVGRNTAAALGALFGYVLVIENVVGGFLGLGVQRWLVLRNAVVFISGRPNAAGLTGRSVTAAGLYLGAVAIGLYVLAAIQFQRRDVA